MILPGTGRGTSRRLVEGAILMARCFEGSARRTAPSTVLRTVPLPMPGRILP